MSDPSYHHENLRDELIKAGLNLLDEGGYENLSLRGAAKACGVSHTAPYRHFQNKDELVYAIAARALQQFNETLKSAVGQYPNDPQAQLREMGCRYIQFFLENPEYMRLFFLNRNPDTVYGKQEVQERLGALEKPYDTFYQTIVRICEQKTQDGKMGERDPRALTLANWGLVHGIAILLTQKEFEYDGDVMELVKDIIWDGNTPNL